MLFPILEWLKRVILKWETKVKSQSDMKDLFFQRTLLIFQTFEIIAIYFSAWPNLKTRVHWLDRRIGRKQQSFDDFEVKYLQIENFLKIRFHSNWKSYLVLISGQKPKKIVWAVFEKNIKLSDFGLIWRRFREYLQIKNFFQKSGSVTFLLL